MKIYSNDAVTKDHLDEIDAKQARQIKALRYAVAFSFAANLLITLGLKFL